ncbi:MAG: FecR family protein [Parahaliea sp.]
MNVPTDNARKETRSDLARTAADWCMRLQSGECSAEDRAAFEQWVKQDPAHEQVYNKILRVWTLGAHLTPTVSAETPKPTRARTVKTDVAGTHPARWQRPRPQWQAAARLLALALLLALPLGYGGWLLNWVPHDYHRYSTDRARRTVELPDGTRVEMNLNTQIRYANYRNRRQVVIKGNGEAFFRVSHHAHHPFEIKAAEGTITVTGTAFNVWKYRKDVVVTVVEGSVVISNNGSDIRLNRGMQAEYRTDSAPHSAPGEIDDALAWQSGKLVLDDLPLAVAIPKIGRYLDQSITLKDAAVADLRIGGIYNTGNMESLVAALPEALPLTVKKRFFGGLVLSSRPPTPRLD